MGPEHCPVRAVEEMGLAQFGEELNLRDMAAASQCLWEHHQDGTVAFVAVYGGRVHNNTIN